MKFVGRREKISDFVNGIVFITCVRRREVNEIGKCENLKIIVVGSSGEPRARLVARSLVEDRWIRAKSSIPVGARRLISECLSCVL